MGLTLLTLGSLLAPLQSVIASLLPHGSARAVRHPHMNARSAALVQRPAWVGRTNNAVPQRSRRPLRVVRIIEPSWPTAGAGRIRISGRMADVCAELDRLAALEAAAG